MAPPDSALLYKVAYDEAVRALAEQQAVAESLRSRTGLLLSAAAVTTSFLGAQALHPGDRDLSLHMHESCVVNDRGLVQLAGYFQIAVVLLTIEQGGDLASGQAASAASTRREPAGHLSASRLRR